MGRPRRNPGFFAYEKGLGPSGILFGGPTLVCRGSATLCGCSDDPFTRQAPSAPNRPLDYEIDAPAFPRKEQPSGPYQHSFRINITPIAPAFATVSQVSSLTRLRPSYVGPPRLFFWCFLVLTSKNDRRRLGVKTNVVLRDRIR